MKRAVRSPVLGCKELVKFYHLLKIGGDFKFTCGPLSRLFANLPINNRLAAIQWKAYSYHMFS